MLLSFTNSLVNPVIYTVRKREFRFAFRELLLAKCFKDTVDVKRSFSVFRLRKSIVNPEDQRGDETTTTTKERGSH